MNVIQQLQELEVAGKKFKEITVDLINAANHWLAINNATTFVVNREEALEVSRFVEKYFSKKEKSTNA